MRQLAVKCGYTAASLRERIYSKPPEEDNGPMAGILIYTAASDSEGTLGGLVSLGEPATLGCHLDQALEQMRLCASDPLCAEHSPLQSPNTLHWAACHACLFSPETAVAEELPALILDSIAHVLTSETNTATLKRELLSLLPKPAWRQEVGLLLDRWQTGMPYAIASISSFPAPT